MNKRTKLLKLDLFQWVVFLAISFLFAGCSVKLVSDYDEITDQSVTAFHKKMEGFFLDLERGLISPEKDSLAFRNYEEFYDSAFVDISAMSLRASAIPNNEITRKQLTILKSMLTTFRDSHRSKDGDTEEGVGNEVIIEQVRSDFNRALAAILKFEIAKKRSPGDDK